MPLCLNHLCNTELLLFLQNVTDARLMVFKPLVDAFDSLPWIQPKKDIRILDAAAGTGLVAEYLYKRGYTNLDALDISQVRSIWKIQ